MSQFKVLIVDDSPFMRRVISDVIDSDESFEVLATAANGKEAVELAFQLKPDIITMDLEMPQMNGLEALQLIMAKHPIPIIMLSAITDIGTKNTIKALQYGALDFIRKPDGAHNLDINQVGVHLLEKLHIALETMNGGAYRMMPAVEEKVEPPPPKVHISVAASATIELEDMNKPESSKKSDQIEILEIPVKPKPAAKPVFRNSLEAAPWIRPEITPNLVKPKSSSPLRPPSERLPEKETKISSRTLDESIPTKVNHTSTFFTQLVAIGTSTGGPRALHEVLTGIPAGFPAPILIVQHMPPKFTKSLAQRLDNFCHIHVREAVDGELVESATAYIAPGGFHMILVKDKKNRYCIQLSQEGPVSGHMPSVNVLFESLVGEQSLKRHVVLMTGMGSDGAKGMKALQTDGAITTIAEAEQSCVVYGMPRSAVELGAVSHVLPLQQIASKLVREVTLHNKS